MLWRILAFCHGRVCDRPMSWLDWGPEPVERRRPGLGVPESQGWKGCTAGTDLFPSPGTDGCLFSSWEVAGSCPLWKGLLLGLSCLVFECHPVGCHCFKEQTSPFSQLPILGLTECLGS